MISFCIALVLLIAGYFVYGRIIERIFGSDPQRPTPAYTKQDGVDYVPMKPFNIFMIQFLNIAGLGPIFGAIMGAKFGTASFLWITFGCIFAGAVHDYLSGMMSLRHDGASLPEIHGLYLGGGMNRLFSWLRIPITKRFNGPLLARQTMRIVMVVLMILVGVVFVSGPANLLANMTPDNLSPLFWIVIIFAYYLIATLLPIDKVIGKVYPIFGACLLFMAVGILVALFYFHPHLPEIWDGLTNTHPQAESVPIFPMMFVSIACGAISGFHATQSPLMARCMTNEKQGRPIFFGAMISEGIVALIWAAAATYFFHENGYGESNAAIVVNDITRNWLGSVGAILAILGVIAAPITSGDTAFRSARLIVADFLRYDQKPIIKRLIIALPLFIAGIAILIYSINDKNGFDIIWRYFSWMNQVLAMITLWTISLYLIRKRKPFIITFIPALFMTMVAATYICIAPEGFQLPHKLSYIIGGIVTLAAYITFSLFVIRRYRKIRKHQQQISKQ